MLIISCCFIAEKELKTTVTQLSYKEALITGMKEFVDEFYSEISVKISSMKKEQKREIRDIKGKMKTETSATDYSVNSNLTISSWASEKQYEIHKQLSQLVSESRSQLESEWDSSHISSTFSLWKRRETWRIFAPSQENLRVCFVRK